MGQESNITPFKIKEQGRGIMYSLLVWFSVLALVVLDQLSKIVVWKFFCTDFVEGNGIGITCYKNYEFAFSIPLAGIAIWIIYIAILVFGFIMYFKKETWARYEIVAVIFVLAGVLSNAGERLLGGSVKDFIYLFSGIFNFADIYILIGVVIAIVGTLKSKKTVTPPTSESI